MKTLITVVAFCLIALSFSACSLGSSDSKAESSAAQPVQTASVTFNKTDGKPVSDWMEPSTIVAISKEDFQLMVDYIKAKGFTIPDPYQRGDDRQYTFYDSKNNRHAMIPVHLPEKGKYQISVWAYRDSVKDQDHFFGYEIDSEHGARTYLPDEYRKPGEVENIKRGVEEFLAKVKKST